jgi:predicted DNA-binding helix-hairpin-helix protein
MRQIQSGIAESRRELGFMGGNHSAYYFTNKAAKQAGLEQRFHAQSLPEKEREELPNAAEALETPQGKNHGVVTMGNRLVLTDTVGRPSGRGFAAAGQSTQMIIGATPETDFHLVSVAEALYRRFDLKRVFYSAFVKVNDDANLPDLPGGPPLLREHRLYQADWLMRFYGFRAGELLTEQRPNFNQVLDPKCDWAVHHLELFPVEVLKADYFLLLRVPGIGPKSAKRIVTARKSGSLSFEDLKKVGVVLKRARYFITCGGRALGRIPSGEGEVTRSLMAAERLPKDLKEALCGHQISLFELPGFSATG